jgi:predicted membrane-bound spermidine synthase
VRGSGGINGRLLVVFFVSGFAALLYQLVWQRTLFALLGINIESVTIVVTAFMLGLGCGGLVGGWLSRASAGTIIRRFALAEIVTAAYGAASLRLFQTVGEMALPLSGGTTALVTFLLLLPPTMAMGATLPLLVAFAVRMSGNIGWSVGVMYAVNTLGSSLGAFAATLFLMRTLGQQGVIWVAVVCNLSVAATVLLSERLGSR